MLMEHHILPKVLMQKSFLVSIHIKQLQEVLDIIFPRKPQRNLLKLLLRLTVTLNKRNIRFMTYEFISMIADISLALSLVAALGFGIVQLRQAARDRRERFTIETLRNLQTREFAEVEGQLTYHKSPSNFEEFKQLSLNEQTKFIQFSQEMESLGILVAEGLVDIGLIDKTLGLFVITSWQKYKTVFGEIRQKL